MGEHPKWKLARLFSQLRTWCSRMLEKRHFFMFLSCYSNYKNITRIAHSYHKKITRKSNVKRRKLEHRYSNGNDYRYEAVKNEIRFRWGKKSITDKDKPLKALAVAAPYFVDMDVADDSDAPPKPSSYKSFKS